MLVGKPAPDFTLERLKDGQTVTLSAYRGKPMVLNFWASWCVPCRYEHPVLEWGYEKFGEQAQFVGVIYEDSKVNVADALTESKTKFEQLFDEKGRAAVDYGLAGVPETYFIDATGVIRYKYVGPLEPQALVEKLGLIVDPAVLRQIASKSESP